MKTEEQLQNKRHSLAHLLATAVLEIYGDDAKLAFGPAIDNGFYYDIEFPTATKITENDLVKIESKMKEILPTWKGFERKEVNANDAKSHFMGNQYKNELIDEISAKGEPITFYTSEKFTDLCRGGHAESMKEIDPSSFKLSHVAGAYWRGDEKNAMLTRIYGLAFNTKQELEEYLAMLLEAKKRDHKKLGPELGLFMFHETAPGMPYWLPKGSIILHELINFWREEHRNRHYQEILSPLLNKKELYVTSGHFEHFWQDMFTVKTEDGEEYGLKAMNCPNAMVVFGSTLRSYKDLPLRLSDTDTLHRNERSGVLNGLLRVREFKQDDAHIFIPESMIGQEYQEIFEIVERFYSIFNISYSFRLGTRPPSFLGDEETWGKAEETLKNILKSSGKPFTIAEGDGAFYGPKIDIVMKDALGREWQMGTIQLDFQQPRRFKLEYVAEDGKRKTPIVIHRVIYGSLERFIGILIEHFAGAFPLWLAPVQAVILPISEKQNEYAENVFKELSELMPNLRLELDKANESIGKKIRAHSKQKIPYLVVVGDKEKEAGTVSVRGRGDADLGAMTISDLAAKLKQEIRNKK